MEGSTSPKPMYIAPRLFPNTNDSNAGSSFLSLPIEIRLIIYGKLLIQSDGLLRSFCTCKFCANLKSPTIGRECLSPSLLRTSKAILNETLPVLYSKNMFLFFCYGPFAYTTRLNVSRHRIHVPGTVQRAGVDGLAIGPIANRHSAWAGVAKIIKCPSDGAKSHVRRISLKLDCVYQSVLDNFPKQWWHPVESDVLRFYPGVEQIEVLISASRIKRPTFHLVFQRKDSMAGRKQNFESILADAVTPLHARAGAREDVRDIEAVCDAIAASQTQGEMEHCKFGVKSVSWTDDYLIAAGSDALGRSTSICLGCC